MYELTIETKFSAAHQLRNYQGKCERLHGHNWRVNVSLQAMELMIQAGNGDGLEEVIAKASEARANWRMGAGRK